MPRARGAGGSFSLNTSAKPGTSNGAGPATTACVRPSPSSRRPVRARGHPGRRNAKRSTPTRTAESRATDCVDGYSGNLTSTAGSAPRSHFSAFFVCFLNHFVCARWHRGCCSSRVRARKCSGPPLRRSAGAIASPTTACLKATGSVFGPPCPAMYRHTKC